MDRLDVALAAAFSDEVIKLLDPTGISTIVKRDMNAYEQMVLQRTRIDSRIINLGSLVDFKLTNETLDHASSVLKTN